MEKKLKFYPFAKMTHLSIGMLVARKSINGEYDLGHDVNYDVSVVTELLNGMGKVGECYYFPNELIKVEEV